MAAGESTVQRHLNQDRRRERRPEQRRRRQALATPIVEGRSTSRAKAVMPSAPISGPTTQLMRFWWSVAAVDGARAE